MMIVNAKMFLMIPASQPKYRVRVSPGHNLPDDFQISPQRTYSSCIYTAYKYRSFKALPELNRKHKRAKFRKVAKQGEASTLKGDNEINLNLHWEYALSA